VGLTSRIATNSKDELFVASFQVILFSKQTLLAMGIRQATQWP